MKFYPEWDERCSEILGQKARHCTNSDIAAAIEAETGKRFSVFAISRRRAKLGLEPPNRNDWSAPITQWRGARSRSD